MIILDTSNKQAEYAAAAKILRDAAEVANLEWPIGSGYWWQVQYKDTAKMEKTIKAAELLNAPPETTVNWTLVDNSERPTTADDLRQVLLTYTLRMQTNYIAYQAWRASGMKAPFVLE